MHISSHLKFVFKKVRTIHKSFISQNADIIYIPCEKYFCMRTVHQDLSDSNRFWIRGVLLEVVQTNVGHTSIETTMHYLKL